MIKSISLILLLLVFLAGVTWSESAEEWLEKGNKSFEAMTYDEAIKCYKKAITLNPVHAGVHTNLGSAYFEKGMLDEAISEHKKAIAINPNFEEAHYNLGIAYENKKMLDEAISEYKKALTINPNHAKAYNNLGLIYENKGMLTEAIAEYKKAVEISANLPYANYNLGRAYLKKDLHAKAANYFYQAGLSFLSQGNREMALNAYKGLRLTKSKELERALHEKMHPELKQKKSEPLK